MAEMAYFLLSDGKIQKHEIMDLVKTPPVLKGNTVMASGRSKKTLEAFKTILFSEDEYLLNPVLSLREIRKCKS